MSNYKSKHTGAQVDEAVSKVLNGEVGGGATPDWNAQKGKAGYIENKTHYEYTQIIQSIDEEYKIPIEVNLSFFNVESYRDYQYIKLKNDLVIYTPDGKELYDKLFIPKGTLLGHINDSDEIYDIQDCITNFSVGGSGTPETTIIKENKNWFIKHYNDDYDDDILLQTEIKKIDEKYLPDTVLKTTPQSLSDADKNQALANLGIDPVVWKYMCNPYIISGYGTSDNYLPEELRNIIEDEDGYLTTLALKVLAMNYDDATYSINYVTGTTIKSDFGVLIYEQGRFYPEP